ncbi:MAG: tannase/feruloyl esterase family alpha/beta hydrolase [Bryobacteraceae bacterium]|nr:tannase/feruloyl esterase family alpha/beta hydrolase [Bryobacteraceae bacterium]
MRLLWPLLAAAMLVRAQPPAAFLDPPAGGPPAAPKIRCAALRALTGFDFTVESAVAVPAAGDAPAYCRVMGQVLPEIRFEVSLPSSWNRRFLLTGNGGYAGDTLDSPQRVAQRRTAMERGFVAAVTNTGHDARDEPLASFAVNRQKLLDYAFRSLHVTAEAGKRIAAAYYGAPPERSYYQGCSTGGRQGLILAQRFPDDFHGIVAGAPVLNFTGTMVGYARIIQALNAAPLPYAKLALLAERVYALCDDKDGLKDGLIDDPRRCDFQPSRDLPRCAGSGDDASCFTGAQAATLEAIYGDVKSQGKTIFPGWPVGAEIAGPNGRSGWDMWLVRETPGKTVSYSFAESFFRYMAFPRQDEAVDLNAFDFDKHPQQLDWIRNILDATDPDLSAFRDRGHKMLMYFGWADPALNPQMGVDYYDSVLKTMGSDARDFFRLFMQPGVFHCGGGVGPGSFEPLLTVIDWVERGKAPDRIDAARVVDGKTVRTRPLCPYPERARYQGSGSIDEAANFRCAAP